MVAMVPTLAFRSLRHGQPLILALALAPQLFAAVPRGVFCLLPSSTGGAGDRAEIYSNPDIDGISIRQRWCDLEPSEGVFDFTFLDTVISKSAAAAKPALLRISSSGGSAQAGGNTPAWVFNAVKAEPLPDSQKFFTFDNSGKRCTIPVFWDQVFLEKKKAMIAALGAHYANNPVVKIVSVSFANSQSEDWAVPHTAPEVANWRAAGYTTEKLLNAGKQMIDATMSAFPYQYVTLATNGNGPALDPDENYVARAAVAYAATTWPGRLIVQKNALAAYTPPAPASGSTYELLAASAPMNGAQMLWSCYGDNTYRVNNGVPIDPAKALTKSVDIARTYGVNYVEIYRLDLLNLPNAASYAHQVLTKALSSPTPSPSPTSTPAPTPSATPTATPAPTPISTPTGAWTDLKISLTNGKTSIFAGQKDTCTMVVTNTGPYNVNSAAITDIFPAGFSGVTFTASQTGGASGFAATGSGNITDVVNIPVGSSITYKVSCTISSSASGTLSNIASVSTSPQLSDSNPANNTAVDTNAVITQADLTIDVNDWDNALVVGDPTSYTITVSNRGPSDAIGATVKDSFPGGFTAVTYSATQVGGASGFTAAGNGNINDTVTLPAGARIIYKAKGIVSSPGTGTLRNTASVISPAGLADPNPGDNSASDTDTVACQADLKVSVDDWTDTVVPGQKNSYLIQVSNSGPTEVSGAVLKDNFPNAFTKVTFTATQVGGASGFSASGAGDLNETLTLPAGSHVAYKVRGVISQSASGSLANTVTVTHPAEIPDADLTNNIATDTDYF